MYGSVAVDTDRAPTSHLNPELLSQQPDITTWIPQSNTVVITWATRPHSLSHAVCLRRMKTILSSQTVDIPDKGESLSHWSCACVHLDPEVSPHTILSVSLRWCSRGEVEGPDSDCQGAPWKTHKTVQPHQPGAQPAGQETEEGKRPPGSRSVPLQRTLWCPSVYERTLMLEITCSDGGWKVLPCSVYHLEVEQFTPCCFLNHRVQAYLHTKSLTMNYLLIIKLLTSDYRVNSVEPVTATEPNAPRKWETFYFPVEPNFILSI